MLDFDNTEHDFIFVKDETDQSDIVINELSIYDCPQLILTFYDNVLCLESSYPIALSRLDQRLDINRSLFLYQKTWRSDRHHAIKRLDGYPATPPIKEYENLYKDLIVMKEFEDYYEPGDDEEHEIHVAQSRETSSYEKRIADKMNQTDRQKVLITEEYEKTMKAIKKWYSIGISDVQNRMDKDIEILQSRISIRRNDWRVTCQISTPFFLNFSMYTHVYINNRSFEKKVIKHNLGSSSHCIEPYTEFIIPPVLFNDADKEEYFFLNKFSLYPPDIPPIIFCAFFPSLI